MEDAELKKVLETLLFITDAPLPVSRIAQLCEMKNKERIEAALQELRKTYDETGHALQVMQVAGGWQLATRAEYGLWVRKLFHNKMTVRLTQAALETLCIIAYKQPLTRAEIEAIRGVEVIGPLETLTQRKLITVVGRRESIGRPILYGTTSEFLRQFGLNSLDDLPKLESFNIENVAAAAQSTAVELIEQESVPEPEPVAEGAPPQDPAQAALEAVAEEAAAENPGPQPEPAPEESAEAAPETPQDPAVEEAGAEPQPEPAPEESSEAAPGPAPQEQAEEAPIEAAVTEQPAEGGEEKPQ